jgi:uncharacterized membrane protein
MSVPTIHPVLKAHVERRKSRIQDRLADSITRFAGSMSFVYVHVVWFGAWIGFGVEHFPYGLLTMIVSLEAIFLSTFVMIGQNRQASFQQAKADHDYGDINTLLVENTDLTRAIHELTRQVAAHVLTPGPPPGSGPREQ